MTFSNTSKTLRKEKGLSQVQLAEALNISKTLYFISSTKEYTAQH